MLQHLKIMHFTQTVSISLSLTDSQKKH